MARDVPVHYLRDNHKVWTPSSVIFLDTETDATPDGSSEVLNLALWCALHVDRRYIRKRQGPQVWASGTTADELADWINDRTVGRDSLWVYCHNLNFDLAVTALPLVMQRHGWRVNDFSVRSKAPWLRLGRSGRTITVVDSWSLFERPLEAVAALRDRHKPPLPEHSADREGLSVRCQADVQILADAMLALMGWWDENRLGRWTISGAACGWNAMRHVATKGKITIDPTPHRVAWDRRAVRGGRREVTRIGELAGGPYVEVDLESAYPTVARELPLPIGRVRYHKRLAVDDWRVNSQHWGLIAEVEIETDRPRFPCQIDGVTWFPIGRFRTVLAGPEIRWAAELGCLRSIGHAYQYELGWKLQPWAQWVLDVQSNATLDVPPEARMVAKGWGRSVLGKFAGRSQERIALGVAPGHGWGYEDGIDGLTGRAGAMVDMAGQRWWVRYDTEPENAFPAVLAWVESHVRTRIGRVLDSLSSALWVQVDTDGLVLDLSAGARLVRQRVKLRGRPHDALGLASAICDALAPLVAPLRLRPKTVFAGGSVLGPQHLTLDSERRYSGVSRAAEEPDPGTFIVRDWPKLRWQMEHGTPGSYVRPMRTVQIADPKAHGWITTDGTVLPVSTTVTESGRTDIIPWSEDVRSGPPLTLAHAQYTKLDRLR